MLRRSRQCRRPRPYSVQGIPNASAYSILQNFRFEPSSGEKDIPQRAAMQGGQICGIAASIRVLLGAGLISLHNYFGKFTWLCADRICFDANPFYSGSDVGKRAIQRHGENGASRTRQSIGSRSGGRWTWKSARDCRRAFALPAIL